MPTDVMTPIPGINLTYEDATILLNLQKLWLDYVQWMRNHLISVLENIPGQNAVDSQLFLEQPKAIYNELRKYLGDEVAQQYLNIVSRFTQGNWRLVTAYKNNDKIGIDLSISQWFQVGDELASFYFKNFNHLDEIQWRSLVREYLDLKIKEINALSNGNYDPEIMLYNQVENKAIEISYNMAIGIIKKQHQKNESPTIERVYLQK